MEPLTTPSKPPDGESPQDCVGRVLSVDTDASSARGVARVLARGGYAVDCASDARRALGMLTETPYDVVITELALPGMDGAALISEGHALRPSTVYVVVTGSADAHARLEHMPERSVLGVLQKPWVASELTDLVDRAKDVSKRKTSAPAAAKTLLLVEDSDAHADLVRAYLDDAVGGYVISRATTLEEAVALMRVHPFDVVLTDLNLPDARGLDAVRRLLGAGRQSPLVAMSHTLDPDIGAQGLELGACDFLPKSEITAASLARVLAHAVMRRRASQRLEELAFRDALTGLSNARHLRDRLQAAVARAVRHHSECAVVFLDLDGFKPVNDRWGHDAGDHVLRTVARRMDAELRSADTLARIGGDEFAVLLEDVGSVEDVERVVQRLLAGVCSPIDGGVGASVTGSAGIARCPSDGDTPDAILKAADRAMYEAKRLGKNRYAFAHPPSARPPAPDAAPDVVPPGPGARAHTPVALRYVPIVADGAARESGWDIVFAGSTPFGSPGPRPGALALRSFVAEVAAALSRDGELLDLGAGAPGSLALNVPSGLVCSPDFAELVASSLACFGLAPPCLLLFVSEGAALDDDCSDGLARLLDLGFGLGLRLRHAEASVASIARRPYHRLRIGAGVARSPLGRHELSPIVALAHRLGMEAVGDQVSQLGDAAHMLAMGCNVLTGPLFGALDPVRLWGDPASPDHAGAREAARRLGAEARALLAAVERG